VRGLQDDVDELPRPSAPRALFCRCDAEPVLDPLAVRRTHHHVLLEEVVREVGRRQPGAELSLAVRARRDLAHVRIDHRRADTREFPRVEQVLDDVELGALAVELQVDLVARAEAGAEPLRRAHEPGDLLRGARLELVREEAGADAARVVERLLARPVPEAEAADGHAVVAHGLEGGPARPRGFEAIDAVEAVLRVTHRME